MPEPSQTGPTQVMPDQAMSGQNMPGQSDDLWREKLSPERYHVLRQKGTEPAWSGELLHVDSPGVFHCAGCGSVLFSSDDKFDSGSGWPSFTRALSGEAVSTHPDTSLGMVRTEITCAACGGHLGHVFPDGPAPTGQRYCVNSLSLSFAPGTSSPSEPGTTT